MKQTRVKPIVTISTYEERQLELRGTKDRDEPDKAIKSVKNQQNCFTSRAQPPLHLDKNHTSHPPTPSPDYDDASPSPPPPPQPTILQQSSLNSTSSLHHNKINGIQSSVSQPPKVTNGSMKGTMGRCAAHEIAKANGNAAELESIDSFKLTNPASPTPKPPSHYFNMQSSGPATLKKPIKSISVTIGEYSGRKEPPCKFDFIAKQTNDDGVNGATTVTGGDGDVSDRLKSELQKTLNRSNLKARTDSEVIATNGTTKIQINQKSSIANNNEASVPPGNGKPSLHKTQSNVEKITAMLVSQNLMGSNCGQPSNGSVVMPNGNGNRITINIPNNGKAQLRKTESTPINGILKNGSTSNGSSSNGNNGEHKNISFGNITTVMTEK